MRRALVVTALLFTCILGLSGCSRPGPKTGVVNASLPYETGPKPSVAQPVFHYFSHPVFYQDEVVVLMFHDITPHPMPYTDEISPVTFDNTLGFLYQDHFNVIPASLLIEFLEHRATVPPDAVLLTFDDGYQGVYTYGLPILKRYHDPATCFIITGFVGKKPWTMTWAELAKMYDSGLVAIQSHTNDSHGSVRSGPDTTGPALTDPIYYPATGSYESPAQFQERIKSDLALAKEQLEENLKGDQVDMFAYPFGAYDQTVINILQQDGYRFAFTTYGGAVTTYTNSYQIFRINVGTWRETPQSIVNVTRYIGMAMESHPRYQSPPREVPNW